MTISFITKQSFLQKGLFFPDAATVIMVIRVQTRIKFERDAVLYHDGHMRHLYRFLPIIAS